jgi:hypothetical protein
MAGILGDFGVVKSVFCIALTVVTVGRSPANAEKRDRYE